MKYLPRYLFDRYAPDPSDVPPYEAVASSRGAGTRQHCSLGRGARVPHGRVAMPSDWRWFSARIRGPGFGCG